MTNKAHLLFLANGWEYSFGWDAYEQATGHSYYLPKEKTPDGMFRSVFLFY